MRRLISVLVGVVLIATACGGSSPATASKAQSGTVTVLAAASLTEPFTDVKATWPSRHADLHLTYSFAGSQALATQIRQGAPADVFASADEVTMQKLVDAGLVETPRVFARNRLAIATAPGNPKHITALADLARPDLIVVLADPAVPIGAYCARALEHAGVVVHPRSLELDVKSALAKVTGGEADATVVYTTDVKAAGARAAGVAIAEGDNIVARYPIAVVKASSHRASGRAFVAEIVGAVGQRALQARGFLPAQ